MRNFLKKNWSNILFLLFIIVLIIPQTRMPIQVAVQRLISFSPSEINKEERVFLKDYNWELTSLSNEKVHFSSSKGKVVIVNYWATWCPPCVAEMPSFQNLYNLYGDRVDFYFVSSDKRTSLQKFLNIKGYQLPVYKEKSPSPTLLYSEVLPTTFVISKEGEIVINETGAAAWDSDKMKTLIENLLKE